MIPHKHEYTIEEVLSLKGKYIGPTVGTSMLPMLKEGRDTIVVSAKTDRLKPLDVALYKRAEVYVLHRVIDVTDDGYIIRGDNCYANEIVPESAVIGVLTEFFRKNHHYSCMDNRYLKYAQRRVKRYKIRRFFVRCKQKIKGFIKKILKIKR